MVFECSYGRICECGGTERDHPRRGSWRRPPIAPLGAFKSPPPIKLWLLLVKDYTSQYLTKPSDLLHAISGLAESMNDYQWGNYVFGMWQKDIAIQLLWTCSGYRLTDLEESKAYTVPS